MYFDSSNGPGYNKPPALSGVNAFPLLHKYKAPSGPTAKPLGEPLISATVDLVPSGETRVRRDANISVSMTLPSGIATGPSGN